MRRPAAYWWAFWAVFAASMVIYVTMTTWTLPTIEAEAGGLPAFDMRPTGYHIDAAREFLGALNDTGRALYTGPQRIMDLFYPGLLALSLWLGLWGLYRPRVALPLCLAVLVGAVGDYTENHLVAGMLATPLDALTADQVARASTWTVVKSIGDTIGLTALLIGGLAAFWRRRRA
ncbi:hypothetical protein [Mesobacterium pallidum]|uniref:hypothetical protein n=1 Tax=Mesobacterium pallidum TaxID=2872037 RepID=UPI001EE2191D|nr:hypothetical protein [Mesobacterium pallidum]